MQDPVVVSLIVSGLGLALLFLALALLYGLMHLMTKLLEDRPVAPAPPLEAGDRDSIGQEEKLRAAAIAVALACAGRESRPVATPAADEVTGPGRASLWWALHHQRQLAPPPSKRRAR